jgi:tyrosyl-tRNA synthetase
VSSPLIKDAAANGTCVYLGVDPSAISLHLGNLLPMLVLLHFQLAGNKVLALVREARTLSAEKTQLISDFFESDWRRNRFNW